MAAAAILAPIRFTAADETYVVIAGDTACEIAERYSIPCTALIEANRLGNNALIFVEQRLVLPGIGQADGTQVDELPAEPETILPTQVDDPLESEKERAEESSDSKTGLWSVYVLARTHDPRFASFADRTVHLFDGKVVSAEDAELEPQMDTNSHE